MTANEDETEMYDWGDEQYEDRSLNLCGKNIGASDIRAFLESLGDNSEGMSGLKVVDLSGNRIGAKNEDMQPIHEILTASSSSLTALNLCGNPLGEEQRNAGPVLALVETLKELSKIKVLDLSECTLIGLSRHRYKGLNGLGDVFRERKNRLTHLRLCDNRLHSEAALIVAGWLPAVSKLRYLDISRNPLAVNIFDQRSRAGFDPLCGALRTTLHLRTLRMEKCGLDDGEAEGVAAFLASSVRLERLDLSGNQIHTRGARLLAGALRSNGTLVSLLVEGNRIEDEGAKLLVDAIPYTESLEELDVSSNGLTDTVKDAFINAALASITINTYRISGNNIPLADEDVIREYAAANIELRRVVDTPETYDLWEASPIVETSILAKFDRLPPGVAQRLKGNPTFMDEDSQIREAVLRACPLTKSEMLENLPDAARAAIKVKAEMFSARFPGVATVSVSSKDGTEEENQEVESGGGI